MAGEGSADEEYELNMSPVVCLVMGVIASFIYAFGANDKKLWRRTATAHMGQWDLVQMLWLVVKACLMYTLSTLVVAMTMICTVAAMRNKEYTLLFEEHGLTAILAVQVLVFNLLNISIFVRILRG